MEVMGECALMVSPASSGTAPAKTATARRKTSASTGRAAAAPVSAGVNREEPPATVVAERAPPPQSRDEQEHDDQGEHQAGGQASRRTAPAVRDRAPGPLIFAAGRREHGVHAGFDSAREIARPEPRGDFVFD